MPWCVPGGAARQFRSPGHRDSRRQWRRACVNSEGVSLGTWGAACGARWRGIGAEVCLGVPCDAVKWVCVRQGAAGLRVVVGGSAWLHAWLWGPAEAAVSDTVSQAV